MKAENEGRGGLEELRLNISPNVCGLQSAMVLAETGKFGESARSPGLFLPFFPSRYENYSFCGHLRDPLGVYRCFDSNSRALAITSTAL